MNDWKKDNPAPLWVWIGGILIVAGIAAGFTGNLPGMGGFLG
jgi:hypothetical protein